MRFLIRSARPEDEKPLKKLAETFPLCSLPRSLSGIQKKIRLSRRSFAGIIPFQKREYLFVLEDRESRRPVGSGQILASYAGQTHPHFVWDESESSLCLKFARSTAVQVGGLVLLPEFRRAPEKLGRQIGAVRFLYLLHEPGIWPKDVEVSLTAPLRGGNRDSAFWSAVGQKIFSLDYPSASALYQRDFSEFISRIPREMKIDLKSLPEGARRAVRDIHPETLSLYRGLLKSGFKKTADRHFLDGGMTLRACLRDIPFIARGRKTPWRFSEFFAAAAKKKSCSSGEYRAQADDKKTAAAKSPELYLWGQQIGGEFKGGVVEGRLSSDGVFLPSQLPPAEMDPSADLLVTPLNPTA